MDITGNSIYSYYGGGQTSLPTDPTFNTVTVTDTEYVNMIKPASGTSTRIESPNSTNYIQVDNSGITSNPQLIQNNTAGTDEDICIYKNTNLIEPYEFGKLTEKGMYIDRLDKNSSKIEYRLVDRDTQKFASFGRDENEEDRCFIQVGTTSGVQEFDFTESGTFIANQVQIAESYILEEGVTPPLNGVLTCVNTNVPTALEWRSLIDHTTNMSITRADQPGEALFKFKTTSPVLESYIGVEANDSRLTLKSGSNSFRFGQGDLSVDHQSFQILNTAQTTPRKIAIYDDESNNNVTVRNDAIDIEAALIRFRDNNETVGTGYWLEYNTASNKEINIRRYPDAITPNDEKRKINFQTSTGITKATITSETVGGISQLSIFDSIGQTGVNISAQGLGIHSAFPIKIGNYTSPGTSWTLTHQRGLPHTFLYNSASGVAEWFPNGMLGCVLTVIDTSGTMAWKCPSYAQVELDVTNPTYIHIQNTWSLMSATNLSPVCTTKLTTDLNKDFTQPNSFSLTYTGALRKLFSCSVSMSVDGFDDDQVFQLGFTKSIIPYVMPVVAPFTILPRSVQYIASAKDITKRIGTQNVEFLVDMVQNDVLTILIQNTTSDKETQVVGFSWTMTQVDVLPPLPNTLRINPEAPPIDPEVVEEELEFKRSTPIDIPKPKPRMTKKQIQEKAKRHTKSFASPDIDDFEIV